MATPDPWGLDRAGGSICAPPTGPTSTVRRGVHRGRRGHRAAAGEAPRRRRLVRAGRPGPAGLLPTTVCRSSSTTARTWPRPSGPTGSTSARTTSPRSRPAGLVGPDAIIGLSTHAVAELEAAIGRPVGDPARDAPAPSTTSRPGPVSPTPTKPGRPGDRARLRQGGRGPLPLAGVDHRRGRSRHRRGHGRRRGPALRGGPVAHRGRRPEGQCPTTASGDRRGHRRGCSRRRSRFHCPSGPRRRRPARSRAGGPAWWRPGSAGLDDLGPGRQLDRRRRAHLGDDQIDRGGWPHSG